MKNIFITNNGKEIDLCELSTDDKYKLLSKESWAMKAPINEDNDLIKPKQDIINDLNKIISKYYLPRRELYYHFNLGEWTVDLANTKQSMINYDIKDTIYSLPIKINLEKESGETVAEFNQRKRECIEAVQNKLLTLYKHFKRDVINTLKPKVENMTYNQILNLFKETWGELPFEIKPLLENMAMLYGDESVMQNVVGDSGSFKSTRSMIEFNTLPNVLLFDDVTVAGISRSCQDKGTTFLNDTIVYYNDVGDSRSLRANFDEVLETVYKKLYSEGSVKRDIAKKNSDNVLHLRLETPNGFKIKFNSIRPLFTSDYGQTEARVETITIKSLNEDEVNEMVVSGEFGKSLKTNKDPRIFKNIFEVYMKYKQFDGFNNEFRGVLSEIAIADNNHTVNMHKVSSIFYKNEQMFKLYGANLYKDLYFTPNYIKTDRIGTIALKLKEQINKMIQETYPSERIVPMGYGRTYSIAKAKSCYAHKNEANWDAFTITAVQGINTKLVQENQPRIGKLLKILEDNGEIEVVGEWRGKKIYVLVENN